MKIIFFVTIALLVLAALAKHHSVDAAPKKQFVPFAERQTNKRDVAAPASTEASPQRRLAALRHLNAHLKRVDAHIEKLSETAGTKKRDTEELDQLIGARESLQQKRDSILEKFDGPFGDVMFNLQAFLDVGDILGDLAGLVELLGGLLGGVLGDIDLGDIDLGGILGGILSGDGGITEVVDVLSCIIDLGGSGLGLDCETVLGGLGLLDGLDNIVKRNATAARKRDIIPGYVRGDLSFDYLRERVLGQEDAQPLLRHREVARAPATACLRPSNHFFAFFEDDDDANNVCASDEIPVREGNYLWSMAEIGGNVFIGEKSNVACEFGNAETDENTCQNNAARPGNERIYMATFADDCAGEPTLVDITPRGLAWDDVTELRGFACVDMTERAAGFGLSASEVGDDDDDDDDDDGAPMFADDINPDITFEDVVERERGGGVAGSSSSSWSSSESDSDEDDEAEEGGPGNIGAGRRRHGHRVDDWRRNTANSRICIGVGSSYAFEEGVGTRFFVFNGDTGALIKSGATQDIPRARGALGVKGRLFVPVGLGDDGWGGVLEWAPTADEPLNFIVVGDFTDEYGDGAEIIYHNDRLFVTTWPRILHQLRVTIGAAVGLWIFGGDASLMAEAAVSWGQESGSHLLMGPLLVDVGEQTAFDWESILTPCDFDPIALVCRVTMLGGLVEHDGRLYVGTLDQPLIQTQVTNAFCETVEGVGSLVSEIADVLLPNLCSAWDGFIGACDYCAAREGAGGILDILAQLRATTVIKLENFGRGPEARSNREIIFGSAFKLDITGLPFLAATSAFGTYGGTGFGNAWNMYAWSGASYAGHIFYGTFDMSFALQPLGIEIGTPGADIWRFDSSRQSVGAETLDGFGDDDTYGIRTMMNFKCPATEREVLLAGTATFNNLTPHAGWRLMLLEERD